MKAFLYLAALAAGPLLGRAPLGQDPPSPPARKPVTVILVRHCETEASTRTERDPALSEAGRKRARDLGRLLSRAGVTHLWASQYQRTGQTLAPLAEASGLSVEVIPAQDTGGQVEALKGLPPGAVAVVAGHSNTVPALVAALGGEVQGLEGDGPPPGVLPHTAYDRLFVVTLPAARGAAAQTIELRYGP